LSCSKEQSPPSGWQSLTLGKPYDVVAALTRHINQRNKESARQKHSPDQYKALYKELMQNALPKKDVDATKSNIYNIIKKVGTV
jgi:hypothetical protein